MKTIEDIYGVYMTPSIAKNVVEVAEKLIPMLVMARQDRVYADVHDIRSGYSSDALKFWEEILKQYKDYISTNDSMGVNHGN